jgi:hypothetical protein
LIPVDYDVCGMIHDNRRHLASVAIGWVGAVV